MAGWIRAAEIVGKWMREKEMEADRDRKYDWKDRSLSCVFMYLQIWGQFLIKRQWQKVCRRGQRSDTCFSLLFKSGTCSCSGGVDRKAGDADFACRWISAAPESLSGIAGG